MRTVNLEQGRPDRHTARQLLLGSLRSAKALGHREVKFIHGYGSHGVGGAIRREVRAALADLRDRGEILAFLPGEEFDPFHPACRELISRRWELTRDPDYCRGNGGITIVILK